MANPSQLNLLMVINDSHDTFTGWAHISFGYDAYRMN